MQAITYLDEKVIGPLYEALKQSGEPFRIMVLPDHPTPVRLRTHTAEDVPYLMYDSEKENEYTWKYNEKEALASGNRITQGHHLIDKLFA